MRPIRIWPLALILPSVLAGTSFPQAVQAQVVPGGATCPAGTVRGPANLIQNGNFAQGNVGFTTDARLPFRGINVYPSDPLGGYAILTQDFAPNDPDADGAPGFPGVVDPQPFPGDATNNVDPSNTFLYSNPGAAAVVDPANPPVIWQQAVGVQPNTTYSFIAYFLNLLVPGAPGLPPQIQLAADGQDLGPLREVTVRQVWQPIQFTFTTRRGQRSVTLSIVDQALTTLGDDFGLVAIGLNECLPIAPSQQADLRLSKTVDIPSPNVAQNITYTVTLTNDGPDTATNVTVTDRLPAGLTFVSATPSVGSFDGATGVWSIPSLASGSSVTLQIVATVNTSAPVTNTAQVTAADQDDPDSTPNNNDPNEDDQASITIPFAPEPRLRLVKRITAVLRNGAPLSGVDVSSFVDDPADPDDNVLNQTPLRPIGVPNIPSAIPLRSGDQLEYTVYFLSDGNSTAFGVNFCDPVPSGTTFLPNSFSAGQGIVVNRFGATVATTNTAGDDIGSFFPALNPAAPPCANLNNPNGSVFVELGDLPITSPNNVGFARFRVQVN